jgi:succinate dehydrogenase / fumarate reductase membrane anchor subunit
MALYSRSGRPRPQSGGFELAAWYYMRLSGLALFFMALLHFSVMHFVFDPAQQDSAWIIGQRWGDQLIRTFDWLFLTIVLSHAFVGVRTVAMDYIRGFWRWHLLMLLYFLAAVVYAMGTIVVFTAKLPGQ